MEACARSRIPVVTSAAVVAQVWRSGPRQALLAKVLKGVEVVGLLPNAARGVGELLATSGTADVVDAHVALLCRSGDTLLASDPDDLRRLLANRNVDAKVVRI